MVQEGAKEALTTASPTTPGLGTASPAAQINDASLDSRHGYRHVRYSSSQRESQLAQQRAEQRWQHARPSSIFIAAMGNHWAPGSWQAIMDMVHFTNQHGYYCAFEELMDRCFQPYDNLGSMRNEGIMKAMQGYDWLLYLDNDVLPPQHALVQLIERERAIIAPFVIEPATGRQLHGPPQLPWRGVQTVRWCVLSMLLFRTSVFNATGVELWNNGIGSDEGYHFQKLAHFGHYPAIDTELQVRTQHNPTYPLATNRMTKEESERFWDARRARFLEVPDRKPVDPNETRLNEFGEYLPFVAPTKQERIATTALVLPVGTSIPPAVAATDGQDRNKHFQDIAKLAALVG